MLPSREVTTFSYVHVILLSPDQAWVKLERIQFVGACNPPTDPGRKPLSHRFLRHVPVVYVDYPGETSLKQIYGTFNRAMLRIIPSLRCRVALALCQLTL